MQYIQYIETFINALLKLIRSLLELNGVDTEKVPGDVDFFPETEETPAE